jgi:hypothetical protein
VPSTPALSLQEKKVQKGKVPPLQEKKVQKGKVPPPSLTSQKSTQQAFEALASPKFYPPPPPPRARQGHALLP